MRSTIFNMVLMVAAVFGLHAQLMHQSYKKLTTQHGLSHNHATDIIQGKNGFIWIATSNGLNKYDGYNFTIYKTDTKDSTSIPNNTITSLAQDKKGFIWIATDGGGIAKFDPVTETFKQYSSKLENSPNASNFYYYLIVIDSEDRIWACHYAGLDLYNPELDIFENIVKPFEKRKGDFGVTQIVEDKKHGIWLGTNNQGLVLLDPETLKIKKVYTHKPGEKNSLGSTYLNGVLLDETGMLWVVHGAHGKSDIYRVNPFTDEIDKFNFSNQGFNDEFYGMFQDVNNDIWMLLENGLRKFDKTNKTLEKLDENIPLQSESIEGIMIDSSNSMWLPAREGVLYYSSKKKPFNFIPNVLQLNNYVTKSVDNIYVSKDKSVWYGNQLFGLRHYDPVSGKTEDFPELHQYIKEISSITGIFDVLEDHKGNIWIAQYYGIMRFNPKTGKFKNYSPNFIPQITIGEYNIIYEDRNGLIWAGTYDGWLYAFDPEKEKVVEIFCYYFKDEKRNIKKMPGEYINVIYENNDGDLYIGSTQKGLFKIQNKTHKITEIKYQKDEIKDSNAQNVTAIHSSNNILWIGTGNGLYKKSLKTNTIVYYGIEHGLPDNYISHILEDAKKNLWITTIEGVSKFDPVKEKFVNYQSEDGLKQSGFQEGSGFKDEETGLLYFGGANGFNVFDPNKIKDNLTVPPIVITGFKKHNAEGNFTSLHGINYRESIELSYNERDFTIQIAALDYTNSYKNQYAYWLEGYNKNWVEIGTQREITFTNLSPGTYKLKLKGSNNDEIWNEKGRSLQITILPAWWGTNSAISFYCFAFLALLYGIYRYRINQLETIKLKELDEIKRTMYTNITHEFRTPLTVISGINKELKEQVDEKYAMQFDLIERNSKSMLNLVNQLLELRKLEIDKVKLNYIQGDIISYLKYITESFKTYGRTKSINLYFVCISEKIIMDYDSEKLLMIISNLLSNSIKYSKPGTDIYFQVDEKDNHLQIRVVDSGQGIPEEQLPYIFDRFYKVKQESEINIDGIGVGLAVTKELVKLLEGEIAVSSKLNKGSIFTVKLPITNSAPLAQPIKTDILTTSKNNSEFYSSTAKTEKSKSNRPSEELMHLLLIEDNEDIIQYLTSILQQDWQIDIARDGQKGIDKAIEQVPDIILCDLMMPNKNGYDVMNILKNDQNTSHIPVVILTAKADQDSRIQALKKGADSFLLKPFNKEELLIVLQKLVDQRLILQERFRIQDSLRFAEGIEIHKEDTFIKKLEQLVLQDTTTSVYNVSSLCEDLGMSRTQLHNKIKALTGRSTSIFVRSLRLQKGKFLLQNTNKTISEVAYEVGFNNPSYFSRSFTEEFGLSPSSFRK